MAPSTSTAAVRQRRRGLDWLRSEHVVLWLSGAYILAVAPFTPGMASIENVTNVISSLLPLFILGIGQTLVLITGGIDLSITSIVSLTSIAGAALVTADGGVLRSHPLGMPLAMGVMVGVGAGVGLANGAAITRLRMPPFMVTLTSMMFLSGLAIRLTHSRNIGNLPASFNVVGHSTPIALLVTGAVAALAHVCLSRSLFGRWIYAVGHNSKAALISGVPVRGVTTLVYVLSGVCAAVASVLYSGRLETGSPVLGQRILLDVIGATVIGGTSLYGGRGKVVWTFCGALFLTVLDNSLNLLNLSYFTIMMAKGAVILLAATIDAMRHRWLAAS